MHPDSRKTLKDDIRLAVCAYMSAAYLAQRFGHVRSDVVNELSKCRNNLMGCAAMTAGQLAQYCDPILVALLPSVEANPSDELETVIKLHLYNVADALEYKLRLEEILEEREKRRQKRKSSV